MGLQNSDREPAMVTDLRNRLLVAGARRVIVISNEIERAVRRAGVGQDRITRCPVNGIDPDRFRRRADWRSAVRAELDLAEDAHVVTTIGALHPRKSHGLFLEAAAEVAARDDRARFLVVGEGPERAALLMNARRLDILNRVRLPGARRDVPGILSATDVYVKPGIVEGFIGITVLEAMAADVPVVAFDTRDVRAAVEPERTGLIAPPSDTSALARAILRVLEDAVLSARLIANAAVLVRERFALDAVARQLEGVYTREAAAARGH